jgi:hypothetical protein
MLPPSRALQVLRGRPDDAAGDPFAFLSPEVTTPQHVVGAFLAALFLLHSWPIFKVSPAQAAKGAYVTVNLRCFNGAVQPR